VAIPTLDESKVDLIARLAQFATEDERDALADQMETLRDCERTEKITASLFEYARDAWEIVEPSKELVANWHLGLIAEHLEAVDQGQIQNLLINQPPGTTKSLMTSVFWPTWTWAHEPGARFLCASYEQGLSTRDATKARAILDSEWYRQRWGDQVAFAKDQNQKTYYLNTKRGWRLSTTPGARGLGEHPTHIVIDDPAKVRGVHSEADRQALIEWWTGTVVTRGMSGDVRRVVVAQRLAENDLPGYLLKEYGDDWVHINLPMRYEEGAMKATVLGGFDPRKEEGELLCPELFDEEKVRELESTMGPYFAAGQLQQRPAPSTGGIFQRPLFLYYRQEETKHGPVFVLTDREQKQRTVLARDCMFFQTVDTAMKVKQTNDYTVCTTFVLTPQPFALLVHDVFRARLVVPEQYAAIMRERTRYPVKMQAVEDRQSGTGIIQEGMRNGTPFFPLQPDVDKVTRCVPLTILYQNGMVYHRAAAQAPWLEAFETELLLFPNGEYDDQVDTAAYGGILFQGQARQMARAAASMGAWPQPNETEAEREDRAKHTTLAEQMTGRKPGEAELELPWRR